MKQRAHSQPFLRIRSKDRDAVRRDVGAVPGIARDSLLDLDGAARHTDGQALEADGDGREGGEHQAFEGGEHEAFEGHDAGIAGGEAEVAGVGG